MRTAVTLPESGIDFAKVERMTMVACGTAFYACLVAKYWFEQIARMPVEIDVASEFRYREPPVTPGTAALFVSQSGETADTLAALRYMEGKADTILSSSTSQPAPSPAKAIWRCRSWRVRKSAWPRPRHSLVS